MTQSPVSVTFQDVQKAAQAIDGAIAKTPLNKSITLSKLTGAEIYIKFENLQFTASFKERGALNKLMNLTEVQKKNGVIAASAGNHAQGVAYHGSRLGIPTTIVMPVNTPFVKVRQTEEHGATVVMHGERFDDTAEYALQLAEERNLTLVHPFNDEDVIAGQGTLGIEMLEACPDLDVILVPVGGGGLISGIAIAAKHINPDIEVIGVQAERFPSLHRAINNNEYIAQGSTLAEGIAVKTIGEKTGAICKELVDDILLVTEDELEKALCMLLTIEKTVPEGAGAAPLAAVNTYPERFKGKKVGMVLSGGNIDPRLLASLLMRGLVREGRITRLRIVLMDVPGALAQISRIIGDLGGNIIDVSHHRLFTELPAKETYSNVTLETRDSENLQDILNGLRAAGFTVHVNRASDL
ncbi:threonine ammonia-lyase [Paremcibacter congregatus]|uniref:threonine ammonia-lyase n=1 Tax=Paremcibacter congregatus TaxID=2043170 RepID=UPI0030EE046C|tara:strand:- start:122 stop:1354 length:1233 start_codon:yes stop_codon:yes gene_type:complete